MSETPHDGPLLALRAASRALDGGDHTDSTGDATGDPEAHPDASTDADRLEALHEALVAVLDDLDRT